MPRQLFPLLWVAFSLTGCAGLEFAPKGELLFYHPELPAADRAVEAARSAGKGAQCPGPFAQAVRLRDLAYRVYWSGLESEAIQIANRATARANTLCPGATQTPAVTQTPPAPAAPAPEPLPPPAPAATISASPASIRQGACTTLAWSSTNGASASIAPELGDVEPSGAREVCPTSVTRYTIVVTGEGGTVAASTTVNVTLPAPPPAAPAPKLVARLTLYVNFDSDTAVIRSSDLPELEKAVTFIRKYPATYRVVIEGHTDGRGSEEYNEALSERRAVAVKDYLLKHGVTNPARITTVGYGMSRPIADNSTPEGRLRNRRTEIQLRSE